MKKGICVSGMILVLASAFFTGCGKQSQSTDNSQKVSLKQENTSSLKSMEESEQKAYPSSSYEYPPEDNTSAVYDSKLGYSITYEPLAFTLDDTGELDTFTYNTSKKLAAPVYLSVQKYADMDSQTLAEGLAQQSGIDGVKVQDTYFGIPAGEGSLLLEMGSYVGVPETVDTKFEEMSASFKLR